jgi:hypothetical protein
VFLLLGVASFFADAGSTLVSTGATALML